MHSALIFLGTYSRVALAIMLCDPACSPRVRDAGWKISGVDMNEWNIAMLRARAEAAEQPMQCWSRVDRVE